MFKELTKKKAAKLFPLKAKEKEKNHTTRLKTNEIYITIETMKVEVKLEQLSTY